MTTSTPHPKSLLAGVLAALAGALVGGIAWAVLTGVTGYKIGFAAIGVGALAGLLAGRAGGDDPRLPVSTAVIALLGCVVGDVLIDAHDAAQAFTEQGGDVGTVEVLKEMVKDPSGLGWAIYKAGFKALDALFYALAASTGFRLATAHGAPKAPVQQWAPPTGEAYGEPAPEKD